MTQETISALDFGDQAALENSLSDTARGLSLSGILKIAGECRALVASGHKVANLSVGDFDARYFQIPEPLREGIRAALTAGATNYPPQPGILPLREAIADYAERASGVRYPLDSVLVTSGGRPVLYGAFRTVLSPGDEVLYSVPSWQNDWYAWLSRAKSVEVVASSSNGFQPTLDDLAPHIRTARLLCLCSPGNPTGTAIEPDQFQRILEAVVEENARRTAKGGLRPLFVLFDQIYNGIRVKGAKHRYALALVPESAPYVITMDGISKAFAGTGLRVGWMLGPPAIARKMGELLAHVGCWAPHAEQVGVAGWLRDEAGIRAYRAEMDENIHSRLREMYAGFAAMRDAGYPVDCICPEGAIYVTLQLQLKGRTFDGAPIADNEAIRSLLLEHAGVAVVPFQAFGLREESGWFRLSVGAVSHEEIAEMFPRIRAMLDRVS